MKSRALETGRVFEVDCATCEYGSKYSSVTCEYCDDSTTKSSGDLSTEIDDTPTDTPTAVDDTPTGSDDRPTKEDDMDKQDSQTGLRVKYDVKKVETGETVNNCFVLRPDKDPAAVAALRTYARATPNKALADDIIAWVGASTADRPRLADVLGVEVGEEFIIREGPVDYKCVINQNGEADLSYWKIGYAINHPESVIRSPHLTEAEIAIMRAVGAKWVSKSGRIDSRAELWDTKPEKLSDGTYIVFGADPIARIKAQLFPSVKLGDCILLEAENF